MAEGRGRCQSLGFPRLLTILAFTELFCGLCVAAGEASDRLTEAVAFELSPEGHVMSWLCCGPFPNPPVGPPNLFGKTKTRPGLETDWLRTIGGERKANVQAGAAIPLESQPPRIWRPVAAEALGYVNLANHCYPSSFVVAYAACTLRSGEDTPAVLKIGSNDGVKVWLNGEQVHAIRRARRWMPDEDTVAVRLRKGSNPLLVKVDQLTQGWGFSVRLVGEDGEPLPNVTFELPGQASSLDVLRMFAEGIEVAPERPALTAGESLVVCLRIGPTAAITTGAIVAAAFVEDSIDSRVIFLGKIRLSGESKRTVTFDPWPVRGLADGRHMVRVRFLARDGTQLRARRAPFFYVSTYGRHLAEAKRAVAQASASLKDRQSVLATITLPSLERLVGDAEKRWAEFEDFAADAGFLGQQLRNALAAAHAMRQGRDWFAARTGHIVKAYRDERDGTLQPYSVYVPRNYNPMTSWPLVISLHGATSNHWLNLRRLFGQGNRPNEPEPQAKKVMPALPDVPMLVACPNGRETFGFEGVAENDVWRVLEDMKRAYNVDETRIYLTGLSMGATAAWRLGLQHPDRFAALAAVCGLTDYRFSPLTPARLAPYERILLEAQSSLNHAENALHLPIHIFHGLADEPVPLANSGAVFRRFAELGYRVGLTQYSAVAHDAWNEAYHGAAIFNWFSQYRLNRSPRRVLYKEVISKPTSAYWIRMDAPERLREFSRIDASVHNNRVAVRVENVRRFSLLLNDHLVRTTEPVTITINGQSLPPVFVEEPNPISFALADCEPAPFCEKLLGAFLLQNPKCKIQNQSGFRRVSTPHEAPLLPGLGLREILDWHIFVYGTSGAAEETAMNRRAAERAADAGPWVDIRWPVKADTDLTSDDLRSVNLVLVGTPANHRLLARIADQLPIQVERDAIRLGHRRFRGRRAALFMIYRNPLAPERYVFLQSAFTAEGFANLRFNLPHASPDYIVFDGGGRIARAGFFDALWQLER